MDINNRNIYKSMNFNIKDLENISKDLRCDALKMIHIAKSGHPGGLLSSAKIITALYFHFLKVDPKTPKWPLRDMPYHQR